MFPDCKKLFSAILQLAIYSSCIICHASQSDYDDAVLMGRLWKDLEYRLTDVSEDLAENHLQFLSNPIAFNKFVDAHIAPVWNAKSTTRALLGKKLFEGLTPEEATTLVNEVERTWRRYAHEGLQYYDGQNFSVNNIVLNEAGNRGWVKILMQSKFLPDIYFDLLLKRMRDGMWRAVDVRFKGITYVSIKKHHFRQIVDAQSVLELKSYLSKKNEAYFSTWCTALDRTGDALC